MIYEARNMAGETQAEAALRRAFAEIVRLNAVIAELRQAAEVTCYLETKGRCGYLSGQEGSGRE